jgi:hypothetical protein
VPRGVSDISYRAIFASEIQPLYLAELRILLHQESEKIPVS